MKPVGVIFDFDGVVVDSLAVHLKAWQLAHQQVYGIGLDDTTGLPGRSTGAIANILAERMRKPESAHRLAEEKKEQLKLTRNLIQAFPGALKAFGWLKEQKIPFGIASNAPHAFIEQTLESLGVRLEVILGVDDVPRAKPFPDIFLLCARKCGISFVDHHRVIVLEDSLHGLQAAVSAGMYPIGVTTQHSRVELTNAGAKLVCKNIQEALDANWFRECPGG